MTPTTSTTATARPPRPRSDGRRVVSIPLDEATYDALKTQATEQERSLSGHARFLITRQLEPSTAPQP